MLRIYRYYYDTCDWNGYTDYYVVANSLEEVIESKDYKKIEEMCKRNHWAFGSAEEMGSKDIFNALHIFQKDIGDYKLTYTIEKIGKEGK